MAVSKTKLQMKRKRGVLFLITAIFADPQANIFLTASVPAFVMPCAPRTFSIRSYLTHSKLTSQLVLARHWPARFVLRAGKRRPAMPVVRARL
jgi:hypothetical protein